MKKRIMAVCMIFLLFFSCEKKETISRDVDKTPFIESLSLEEGSGEKKEEVSVSTDFDGNPLQVDQMCQEEKENYLIGEWYYAFPSPADNWGYIFYDNGTFKYYERSEKAIEKLFLRTFGEWHLSENDVEVKLTKYEVSDRAADADTPWFLPYPPDAGVITTVLDDQEWVKIGTLESVVTDMRIEQWDFPPQIILHPIIFDTVLENDNVCRWYS